MSGRSKRESRGSTRGKRESESRSGSARVRRERDRERETEAPSSRGSPVRVKREVEPASAREALAPVVPAVRVKREREADEDSEPEREQRMAAWILRIGGAATAPTWTPLTGRGLKSHAYIHSVQFSHHVFLNLHTLKFYCLPDNYEIIDSSLEDITYVLKPTFTKQQIANLDKQAKLSRAYDGTTYLPGIVGLNNIKANDYANAVLQALSNVPPLRNYFLEEDNYKNIKRPPGDIMFLLVQRFGELMRKLWNPRNFKAHVSPHEMLQAVVLCSKKTFQITKQGDGVDFLSWFLNALHSALGGTKKKKKTIVTDVFQGSMRIFTKKLPHPDLPAEEKEQLLHNDEYQETMVESTFMYLTLDLPTAPLYKDEKEQLIIPQVPLFNILAKFNGITEKEYKTYKENFLKRFQLTKLPPYLIFCIKRFTKNNFFVEKNPTIVNFPITNVDLREYLSEEVQAVHRNTTYDLIANIVHDGKPSEGSYRIHVLHHGTGKWYELQDLQVTDILPQMITLSEAYIQIWKRRDNDETNQQGA
ncbi:U4/U6.U5 tri-snRNP-associated protein 2 isoform X2 [Neophocaena asiaeorientalis asiaeorientalis]|uniref:ubiquitinyl hydrolase 1 n=2 Tax=Neophocaena asiaeorientalis asiaeorientalis TaxID=1706337 RepID=A0A341BAI4_NEOAA|nr:U4/U6.U5 tri-snRNP-associated protein 2 isoform X2 [Neophocaena asiaeorientalis asiaeorientalis]